VGASPPCKACSPGIVKVAPTDSTVLITGETGSRKERISSRHTTHSDVPARAFHHVNCASIPSSLSRRAVLATEGAFTGALRAARPL